MYARARPHFALARGTRTESPMSLVRADLPRPFLGEFASAVAHVLQQTELLGEAGMVDLLAFASHFDRLELGAGQSPRPMKPLRKPRRR